MSMQWEPLLDGSDRAQALEIVCAIAAAVREAPAPDWHGLMGVTGTAMFLAHAEAVEPAEDRGGLELLERALLGELAKGSAGIGLWTGAAGLRFAVSQVATGDGVSELIAYLDHGIHARLAGPALDNYDLYGGLAGVLLAYADDDAGGDLVVSRVVSHLERIDFLHPKSTQLGCAHGIAGVLAALACCHVHGRIDNRLAPMMCSIVESLENVDVIDQRTGWCRGESGIAMAILGAARALRRDDLVDRAISLALAPFERRNGRWPLDAGLCHGASGLAHLCNRMYQATGDGRLGDHARSWLRRTMAMRNHGNGLAGFAMLRYKPEPVWEADPSVLVGAAGIGLALLAGATAIVPSWDRALGADASAIG